MGLILGEYPFVKGRALRMVADVFAIPEMPQEMAPVELRLLVKLSPCCGCDRDKQLLGRAQSCRKVQNRLKVLRFSSAQHIFITSGIDFRTFSETEILCPLPSSPHPHPHSYREQRLAVFPSQIQGIFYERQNSIWTFQCGRKISISCLLLGHIIPIFGAKSFSHLDICEKDLTQSGCPLPWRLFQ